MHLPFDGTNINDPSVIYRHFQLVYNELTIRLKEVI